jgi:hypothetical protein
LLLRAQLLRLRQHAGRQIDAVDLSARAHRLAQIGKIPPGAAADLEHPVARLQGQALRRAFAEMGRDEE